MDTLEQVVADFDASAATEELSRGQALEQMRGTVFVERRRADMLRTFERHAALRADLSALQGYGPFMRAYHLSHLTDGEVAQRAWQAFQPSVPLSLAALIFACAGFVTTMVVLALAVAAIRWPWRRRSLPA